MLRAKSVRVHKLIIFSMLALAACSDCASPLINGLITGTAEGSFMADPFSGGDGVVQFKIKLRKKSVKVKSPELLVQELQNQENWRLRLNNKQSEVLQLFPELSNTMSETLDILVVGTLPIAVPDSIKQLTISFNSSMANFQGKAGQDELECFYEYLSKQAKK